jgi:glycosyltransferase involved in cell wall biosynthesis
MTNPKLSILIPTTPDTEDFLLRLFSQFPPAEKTDTLMTFVHEDTGSKIGEIFGVYSGVIEILVFTDNFIYSIGKKRNYLLEHAKGDYIAFIDDDDEIGPNYFKHAFAGIEKGVDACGLTGIITEDGLNPKKFVHSFLYDHWFEKDNVYYRNNNHLNVIKREIAIQMKFPETNMGEDHDYSKQLQRSGLITTEYWDQEEVIYYYKYRSKK